MSVRFRVVDSCAIQAYSQALRDMEGFILYPLSEINDHFSIVHGHDYSRFFTQMGKTYFILALDHHTVCGIAAFTWKKVMVNGRYYTGLYLADMKLDKSYRGKKIMLRMAWFGFLKWLMHRRYRGCDFVFGVAMQGSDAGDVTRSFSGLHLGKLARPVGVLDIYFCPLEKLIQLTGDAPPYPAEGVIANLSLAEDSIKDNIGLKEFRLASTGQAWPLIHLPFPGHCRTKGMGAYLRYCARQLSISSPYGQSTIACFCLDYRLSAYRQWLADNAIAPEAACTVYDWSVPLFGRSPIAQADYIHLATSEI